MNWDFDWLKQAMEGQRGKVSCVVKTLRTGKSFAYEPDTVHSSASVIKIYLMACLYQQAKEGRIQLTDRIVFRPELIAPSAGVLSYLRDMQEMSVRDLMELMIIVSDNSATNILLALAGMVQVNGYLAGLGLEHTRFRRRMMDLEALSRGQDNTTTAGETADMLERIYRGQIVSPEACGEMMRTLKNQQSDSLIPWHFDEILPEHSIAHKTGGLSGVVHDAAIIDGGKEPFVLCFFGSGVEVPAYSRLMQDASLRIYKQINEE